MRRMRSACSARAANGHAAAAPPSSVMNSRRCSGRDVRFNRAPPAQNRTCGFPAYGSHLGCCDGESGRIRSSAFVTRAWLWVPVRVVLVRIPLGPRPSLHQTSLRSPPQTPPAVGFLRFVRRLHCYYDEVQTSRVRASLASAPRLPNADRRTHTARDDGGQIRNLPGSGAIPLHVMWP